MADPHAIPERARRLAARLSQPSGLAALFIAGLAIRLILAQGGGFPFDMDSFLGWAQRLADKGPWNFYPRGGEEFFVDYPPGYLYVLWVLGRLAWIIGDGAPSVLLLKMPPIIADLGLAWLVMRVAERLTPVGLARRLPVRGLAAAAILLNPAVFFISAVWGQVDVFLAVLVVGSFLLLGTGSPTFRREAGGIALLAVAIGTKPQGAFVLPVVALLLVWRHVRPPVSSDSDPDAAMRRVRQGLARVGALAAVGAAAGFALLVPFRMGPVQAIEFYANATRTYKVTSVFAFNLWGIVGFWRADTGNDAVRVLGIPVVYWGLALFAAGTAYVCRRAWIALREGEDEGRVLVFGSLAITLVGFVVLTRIHERYLFLPVALAATLVGVSWLRRAFIGLSVAYFVNVYFPYIYYLDFVGRPAPSLGGLAEVLYGFDPANGTDTNAFRFRLMSALVAALCLFIVVRGWRALKDATDGHGAAVAPPLQPEGLVEEPATTEGRRRWTWQLHPVGRRAALIALAIFAVTFASRIVGLGHPPGMYFDEVYHARAGAEYLGGKEVFEYTHPPLAKEVQALSIKHLSGFGSRDGGRLPDGVTASTIAPRPGGVVSVQESRGTSAVQFSRIDNSCELIAGETAIQTDIRPKAVAFFNGVAYVAGDVEVDGEPVLATYDGSRETSRSTLPATARELGMAGSRAYLVSDTGDLMSVSSEGETEVIATGAGHVSPDDRNKTVWVSFPESRRIASYKEDGERERVVETTGEPNAIVAMGASERVFVSVGGELHAIGAKDGGTQARLEGRADLLATVPETGMVWAVSAERLRVIEPHSAVVIGRVSLPREPDALVADQGGHRILAISDGQLSCAGGRPQFAWRLGSVVAGAAIVALVFLLAMRLFGNLWVPLLASLFIAVDGLTFTVSRIAMIDGYGTAFALAAWFAALSAIFYWGRAADSSSGDPPRRRGAAIAWLAAAGLFAGCTTATKWTGIYTLAGIGLLFLADGFSRREDSIWFLAPGLAGPMVVGLLLVSLPFGVYLATYIPYFSLGHDFGDFLRLQGSMFDYHASLNATHPFGSPWYGWPWGRRAVYLYVLQTGSERAEIWTIPNLVVFWGGIVAMVAVVRKAFQSRSAALAIVFLAAAVQYLPWVPIGRVTFLYHYLPVVPFLCIALAWWLVEGRRGQRLHREAAIATAVLAVAFFLVWLPMLEGWNMPFGYLDAARNVLPWVFR
ncbi:MAG: phospholipid carrier-dependent glycosyltransferase [Actinomycetota bacterium]